MIRQYILLALAWALFCFFHSLLAAEGVEKSLRGRMGRLAPWYRLLYNIFAVVTVAPAVYMEKAWASGPLFDLGSWEHLRQAVFYSTAAGFVWVATHYNGTNIMGLSPSPGPEVPPQAGELRTSGPLAYVRHPFYALALVLLWSRPLADTTILGNMILCIYIFIGASLEEARMTSRFGQNYVIYKQKVPAFFPFRIGFRGFLRRTGSGAGKPPSG